MRALLLLLTCFVVVAIVLFAMLQAPAPRKPEISVARIDSVERPLPVLESHPATERILESFPEPGDLSGVTPLEDVPAPSEGAPSPSSNLSKAGAQKIDLNRLLALIDDWVYVNYSQFGSQNKMGTIRKTRENEMLNVFEGKELENGITVARLTDDSCTLKLGEETFTLRRVEEPTFFNEVKQQMRPLTVEEQEKAYEYYMRRYGDKFKAYSATYEPPYGTQNPKRVTPEEKKKGLQDYLERYGKQFQQEGAQNPATFPYTEQQKENYIKYWQTFFPDRPMPAFDELFKKNEQDAPGSRVESESQ